MLNCIKESTLSRYKLSEDTLLDIIELDLDNIDPKVSLKIHSRLEGIHGLFYNHQTGIAHINSILSNDTRKGAILKQLDYCNGLINSLLLYRRNGKIYFPKFLLYYIYPEINELIKEWESAEGEGIIELTEKDPLFDKMILVKFYPELVKENLLNSNESFYRTTLCNKVMEPDENARKISNTIEKIYSYEESMSDELGSLFVGNKKARRKYFSFDYVIVTDNDLDILNSYLPSSNETIKSPRHYRYIVREINSPLIHSFGSGIIQIILSKRKIMISNPALGVPGSTLDSMRIIFLPKDLEIISGEGLVGCLKLQSIVFEPGSNLKHVSKNILDSMVTKLTLPSKLETIGSFSFLTECLFGTSFLRFVIFKNNHCLRKIGPFAFYITDAYIDNPKIEESRNYISLPETIEEIGDFAFATGTSIYNLSGDLSDHLIGTEDSRLVKQRYFESEIKDRVFKKEGNNIYKLIYFCGSNIPDLSKCSKLKRIGVGAFRRTSLSNDGTVIIPASVEIIEDLAFSNNLSIKKVVFEKGSKLKYLGEKAFFNCQRLKEVIFGSPVELDRIRYMTFAFTNITTIDLKNLPKLKVVESCAIINPSLLTPDYPLKNTVHWENKPSKCIILNNLHVREEFEVKYRKMIDGPIKSIVLRSPTIEQYLNIINNKEYTTVYDISTVRTTIIKGNNRLTCNIEDQAILEYLEYLNSAKKTKNYSNIINEVDVISCEKIKKKFISKFFKRHTTQIWKS